MYARYNTRAHAVAEVRGDRVLTACGRRYPFAQLSYNRGRKEPCQNCAAALEGTVARRNQEEAA